MGHALEKIHRLLKPGSVLVDIHPTPEATEIEVRVGAQMHTAGWLHETDDYSDYAAADEALAKVVKSGLFAVEREGTLSFATYADTLAELRDYLTEGWENARIDEITLARIEELTSTPERDKDIILRERVRIARLRPI
ncbi:MAG TPA: hypothetical protein VIK33_17090 [Anaerolineae bacterium]